MGCMILPRHHPLVRIQTDTVCFKEYLLGAVKVLGRQIPTRSRAYSGRLMSRLQKRSWCLVLEISEIEGRNDYEMPNAGCTFHSTFLSTLSSPFRTGYGDPLFYEMAEGFRMLQCTEKVARAVLYNEQGDFSVFGFLKSRCDRNKVADST